MFLGLTHILPSISVKFASRLFARLTRTTVKVCQSVAYMYMYKKDSFYILLLSLTVTGVGRNKLEIQYTKVGVTYIILAKLKLLLWIQLKF